MSFLVAVVLVYVAVCALIFLAQDKLLFFPRSQTYQIDSPDAEPIEIAAAGVTLRGWIVNPLSQGPLVIYFGGNAEELSPLVRTFVPLDATTVLINYRGFGLSEGSPSQDALVGDARIIVQTMTQRFGKQRSLYLFGRSLGAGVAALAAATGSPDGLILLSPYRSVTHLARQRFPWAPVAWMLRHPFDVESVVGTLPERILVIYATDDRVIPASESRALLALLKGAPLKGAPLKGAPLKSDPQAVEVRGAHNQPLDGPAIWGPVKAFLGV
ncbi:MAG: alpha/beta hydrolase [Gammaproteobacteria bacterium]|nr:alpha/beta hydrolase [Gammaproteobacteria bacterium]